MHSLRVDCPLGLVQFPAGDVDRSPALPPLFDAAVQARLRLAGLQPVLQRRLCQLRGSHGWRHRCCACNAAESRAGLTPDGTCSIGPLLHRLRVCGVGAVGLGGQALRSVGVVAERGCACDTTLTRTLAVLCLRMHTCGCACRVLSVSGCLSVCLRFNST